MGTSQQTWTPDVPCEACSGTGTGCMEAQADGVPCSEIRSCEKCGRAVKVQAISALATAP